MDIRTTIAPQIRDYLRRDPRFEGRLGVSISKGYHRLLLQVSGAGVCCDDPDKLLRQTPPYTKFIMEQRFSSIRGDEMLTDILALLPKVSQESIVYFETDLWLDARGIG